MHQGFLHTTKHFQHQLPNYFTLNVLISGHLCMKYLIMYRIRYELHFSFCTAINMNSSLGTQ